MGGSCICDVYIFGTVHLLRLGWDMGHGLHIEFRKSVLFLYIEYSVLSRASVSAGFGWKFEDGKTRLYKLVERIHAHTQQIIVSESSLL